MTPLELAAALRTASAFAIAVNDLAIAYQQGRMTADALAAELVRISKAQHRVAVAEHRTKPREGISMTEAEQDEKLASQFDAEATEQLK